RLGQPSLISMRSAARALLFALSLSHASRICRTSSRTSASNPGPSFVTPHSSLAQRSHEPIGISGCNNNSTLVLQAKGYGLSGIGAVNLGVQRLHVGGLPHIHLARPAKQALRAEVPAPDERPQVGLGFRTKYRLVGNMH